MHKENEFYIFLKLLENMKFVLNFLTTEEAKKMQFRNFIKTNAKMELLALADKRLVD